MKVDVIISNDKCCMICICVLLLTSLSEDDVDGGVQLVHVETIDVKGPPPVLPFKPSMKLKKLLPGCPAWALALNDCEVRLCRVLSAVLLMHELRKRSLGS